MDREKMNLAVSSMIAREIDYGTTLEQALKSVHLKIKTLGAGCWNENDILMGGYFLLREIRHDVPEIDIVKFVNSI